MYRSLELTYRVVMAARRSVHHSTQIVVRPSIAAIETCASPHFDAVRERAERDSVARRRECHSIERSIPRAVTRPGSGGPVSRKRQMQCPLEHLRRRSAVVACQSKDRLVDRVAITGRRCRRQTGKRSGAEEFLSVANASLVSQRENVPPRSSIV